MDRNQIKDENGGGSARTSLPFGLCKKYGIALPANATPHDAWEALKGKGISPKQEYEKLKSQKRSDLEGKYDSEKKWVVTKAQNDARKAAQEKANKPLIEDTKKKAIDLLQVADSGYNDPSKVSVQKSPKGNWIINYDGKNTGIVVGADQFNENDLKIDGILEGAPSFKGGPVKQSGNEFDVDAAREVLLGEGWDPSETKFSKISIQSDGQGRNKIYYDGKYTGIDNVPFDNPNEFHNKKWNVAYSKPDSDLDDKNMHGGAQFDLDLEDAFKKHGANEDAILEELRSTGRDYGMTNSDMQGVVEAYVLDHNVDRSDPDFERSWGPQDDDDDAEEYESFRQAMKESNAESKTKFKPKDRVDLQKADVEDVIKNINTPMTADGYGQKGKKYTLARLTGVSDPEKYRQADKLWQKLKTAFDEESKTYNPEAYNSELGSVGKTERREVMRSAWWDKLDGDKYGDYGELTSIIEALHHGEKLGSGTILFGS